MTSVISCVIGCLSVCLMMPALKLMAYLSDHQSDVAGMMTAFIHTFSSLRSLPHSELSRRWQSRQSLAVNTA